MNINNIKNNFLSIHLSSAGYKALYALSCLIILWGCATALKQPDILAIVDGESITFKDLEYSLQVSHRREDLSSTGQVNISEFVQKLINDRLIVQEARRMGMEDYQEVRQKIDAYILRESVKKLYNDEIVRKVSVSEGEIEEHLKRQEAAEKEYESVRKGIEKQIRTDKIDKRSNEYLAELRSRADIEIDRELLDALEFDTQSHDWKKLLKDNRILVRVNDRELTVGEFVAKLSAARIDQKEKLLNNWINYKLVDHEALSRKYETKPDLGGRLQRYKIQVLKNLFIKKMIMPGIKVSKEELEDYYLEHKEEFIKPLKYRIQQISVKNIKDARSIMNSLEGGADFSWLAKKRSKDSFAAKGGIAGWKTKEDLPAPAAEIIDTLGPGDYSPIFETDDYFRIIRLLEKGETEFQDFNDIKNEIHGSIFLEKYNKIYDEYVDRLKKGVQIKVFDERVEAFEKMFKK